MEYKYKVMRPKRTSMKEKVMRGLLALLLVGGALLYFAKPLYAQELDLTLPETDFDFRQIEEDSFLIQEAINKRLRFIDVKNEPTKRQLRAFYVLNAIDMTTSYHMTRNHPNIYEANILLPGKPSAAQFLVQKLATVPVAAANFEEGQIVIANWIIAAVIMKNIYYYETACRTGANYHHITGQNLNSC